jgi:hypothetical protein
MTLSLELMAALGLAIVWVNALLIAAAAYGELRSLRDRRSRLDRAILRAAIERGRGPEGAFAAHFVDQVGRAADARSGRAIHFSDRAYRSVLYGGVVRLEDGRTQEIDGAEGEHVEVWAGDHEPDASPSGTAFDQAWIASKGASGFARTLERRMGPPAVVAIALARTPEERTWVFDEPAARRWIERRRWLVLGFIAVELLALGGATALCFVGGSFASWVTKAGAALCVAWFLGVQPVGVAVSEACRPPHRAAVRGRWRQP